MASVTTSQVSFDAMASLMMSLPSDETAATTASWDLHKKYIVGGPVTCVSFLSEDKVLVGKGPYIEIAGALLLHQTTTERRLIFSNGGSIHGARQTNDDFILLFGGRQVALVHSESFQPLQVRDSDHFAVSDWIWDARIRRNTNEKGHVLALGLANNACEIWHVERVTSTSFSAHRKHRFVNQVRCITYCMAFHGWNDATQDLIIASGTVFNETLVWKVTDEDMEENDATVTERPVDYKLQGHEGVILSLKFNQEGNLLASTSDDRSVRLWSRNGTDWTNVWIGWGHTARVWNVCFSPQGVVTTGEDGTARLWDLQDGKQRGIFRNYASQSIWRVDVCDNRAVLGTNDGSIKCWDLQCCTPTETPSIAEYPTEVSVEVPDDRPPFVVEGESPPRQEEKIEATKSKKKKKKPKTVSQVIFGMDFFQAADDEHCLAVATRTGSLLSFSFRDWAWKERDEWISAIERTNVSTGGANCLSISAHCIAAVGTTRGDVVLKKMGNSVECTVLDGRIFKAVQGLSWIQDDVLVSFHIKGIMVLWKVHESPLSAVRSMILNTTTDNIPTCLYAFENGRQFVAGDSRGNIALFDLGDGSPVEEEVKATDVCQRLHAKEHVNNIISLIPGRVLSLGNDGFMSECSFTDGGKLIRGTCVPIAGLSGASKIWAHGGGDFPASILVSGYYGNTFRVVDFTHRYELMSVDTGGRQRMMSHVLASRSGRQMTTSVAVCASRKDGRNELLLYSSLQSNNQKEHLTTHGVALHGEPVYDACLFATRDDASYTALLSGSEDGTVKLSILDRTDIQESFHLPPQESCVRAVAASRRPTSSTTLLAICGGKLMIDFYLVEDTNESTFCRENLFVRQVGKGRLHDKADIDHRVNAVAAVPNGGSSHLVVTGDSNGSVHCFVLREDGKTKGLFVPGTLFLTEARPILSLDIVSCSKSRHLLFVGTTAGDVSVWLVSPDLTASRLCVYQAHQMGTNSICTSILDESAESIQVLTASVGDDQALTVTEVVIISGNDNHADGMPSCEILSKSTTPEACSSALKGCHFITTTQFAICGYGQRLSVWEWSSKGGNQLLASAPIDVSDVNALSYCKGLAAIGGEGIEMIELLERHMTS